MINLFETFCTNGGLDAITEILSIRRIASLAEAKGQSNYMLPSEFLIMVVYPLKGIREIIKEDSCLKNIEIVKTQCDEWIQSLTAKDIKEMNQIRMFRQMFVLQLFLKLAYPQEKIDLIIQEYKLSAALKFLASESLEKRLNGINEIKELIKKAEISSAETISMEVTDNALNTDAAPKAEVMVESEAKKMIKNWIFNNNVISKILDENTHSELIKRSVCVFEFLGRMKAVTPDMLETLWNSRREKHEDVVDAIYETINGVVGYLSAESIQVLYEKINVAISAKQNPAKWEFLANFTINALKANTDIQEIFMLPEVIRGEPLVVPSDMCLCFTNLFWTFVQDSSALNSAEVLQALTCLKQILQSIDNKKYLFQYLHLCLENVKENVSVPQCLDLAVHIFEVVARDNWILKFNNEYNLINLFITSNEKYEEEARKWSVANIEDILVAGKLKHAYNLAMRFDALKRLMWLGTEKIIIGKDNIKKLCELYIGDTVPKFDTKEFLLWDYNFHKGASPVFNQEETLFLFEIICNSYERLLKNVPESFYQCFVKNYITVNSAAGALEYHFAKVRILEFEKLIGLDKIWDCVGNCTEENTHSKFSELLLDSYTNLHNSISAEHKSNVMRKFIDDCIQKITITKNTLVITNLLKLLLRLFDLINGTSFEMPVAISDTKYLVSLIDKLSKARINCHSQRRKEHRSDCKRDNRTDKKEGG